MSRPPRVPVAPDSFKGSLAAVDVARRMAAGIRAALPDAQVRALPIAVCDSAAHRAVT